MALSPSNKTLLIRSISAVVAVIVVASLVYFLQNNAIRILCTVAVLAGVRELVRVLFMDPISLFAKIVYIAFVIAIFAVASFSPGYGGLGFSIISVFFICFSLVPEGRFESLQALLNFQAKGIVGFVYVGLLPSFVFRLYYLENGMIWFTMLLSVVLVGDTLAYLTGMLWGQKKIMPSISPKKTVVGSIGGLFGSVSASILFCFYFATIPLWAFVLMGLGVGIVAQLGDFFESMLKRVANRKDSGSLMPGHGGILDRLDGILFAAPIVYFFAEFFTTN